MFTLFVLPVTLNYIYLDLSAVTSVSGNATKTNSEVSIDVSWQEATCAAMYDVVITHESGLVELTNTTTETSFVYNVPSDDDDCYTFSVYSIDFLGMRAGSPASTRIGVRCEFLIFYINNFFVVPFFLLILKVSIVDGSTILTMSIEVSRCCMFRLVVNVQGLNMGLLFLILSKIKNNEIQYLSLSYFVLLMTL